MLKRLDPSPVVVGLFFAHLAALIFGLIGLLYVLPNLGKFADDPNALKVYQWSMEYAGSTHIILGAIAMLAFGFRFLGARKTVIFAGLTYVISLTSELLGTGTGWPFGNYSYTDFLGWKVLDHVPYTIPMSWFYMGLASYLLGSLIAERMGKGDSILWTCGLGTWFLTVWDLVLDPAMAHSSLRVKFWEWHETGPYYEMPIKNLVGWSVTGLIFMLASRVVWGEKAETRGMSQIPLAIYVANVVFAMVVSADVGLWVPIVLSAVLGILPAAWIMRDRVARPVSARPVLSPDA
jgi:carotene biosynthesis associated membrane protein